MEYVDNLITVSYSREKCDELLERGVEALRGAGLPVHDIETPSTQTQVLGLVLMGRWVPWDLQQAEHGSFSQP
eukprot:4748088-Amphidinium_carterae.1